MNQPKQYENREPMMSARGVTRKYNEMLESLDSQFQKDSINCYACNQGHVMKTIHVDAGTTPMFEKCQECGEMAKSTFYSDIVPDKPATHEWFRPNLETVIKKHRRRVGGDLDHILNGGLELRKISE